MSGVILFFGLLIGIPVAKYFLSIQPTCFDGSQNQGETAVDAGGPCLTLDPTHLSPSAALWARAFKVRDGSYTAVAYIINPNTAAGVAQVRYRFMLYDSGNILVADAEGTTFIMPGGITPVLVAGISTGNRIAVHTQFQIIDEPLQWERMTEPASVIKLSNQQVSTTDTIPRITAIAQNNSFATLHDTSFIAVAFDPYGNAMAASRTAIADLEPNTPTQITFTWPQPFPGTVGRIDITALLPPVQAPFTPGQ